MDTSEGSVFRTRGYSGRAAEVAAYCIRALARIRLGIEVPQTDAKQLAAIHGDVGEAIARLEVLHDFHSSSGSKRFSEQQALVEAQISRTESPKLAIDAIVEIRKKAHATAQQTSRVLEEARKMEYTQDGIGAEIRAWGESHKRLLDSLNALINRTERRLQLLGLDSEMFEAALIELEEIRVQTIRRYRDERL